MSIRREVIPFIIIALAAGVCLVLLCAGFGMTWLRAGVAGVVLTAVSVGYFLYFFRDPERTPPADDSLIISAADGVVTRINEISEDKYLKTDTVCISILLSLFNVHVNRAPVSGKSKFLGYFPGKHFFTLQEKSSEYNQHNKILIEGAKTRCLINQIVGPVCRRVVYWLDHDKEVDVKAGDRIGMMKFGSRLDMYFPQADITVVAGEGDKVRAGETIVAKLRTEDDS